MIRISLLASGLIEDVVQHTSYEATVENPQGIMLLDGASVPNRKQVCLGDLDAANELLQSGCDLRGCTLFVAGVAPRSSLSVPAGLNLVTSTLPLASLYNRVSAGYQRYLDWRHDLEAFESGRMTFEQVLAVAEERLASPVCLLATDFRLLLSSAGMAGEELDRVEQDAQALFQQAPDQRESWYDVTSGRLLQPVVKQGQVVAYFYLTHYAATPGNADRLFLLSQMGVVFSAASSAGNIRNNLRFKSILRELLGSGEKDYDLIEQRLHNLPKPLDEYLSLCVIRADDARTRRDLVSDLELRYPQYNIADFDQDVVMLLSGASSVFTPEVDGEAMERLLERYDCTAMVSLAARNVAGLTTHYRQSSVTLAKVVPLVGRHRERRILYFKDYTLYYIMHLCNVTGSEGLPDGLMHLCSPEAFILYRYDKTNNNDLLEFMYRYIMCTCSTSKTASLMHMHRNTATYKLNQIIELTGIDFDDGEQRMRMAFSYMIIHYVESVLGHELHYTQYVRG